MSGRPHEQDHQSSCDHPDSATEAVGKKVTANAKSKATCDGRQGTEMRRAHVRQAQCKIAPHPSTIEGAARAGVERHNHNGQEAINPPG